jgi:hypothetical protein
VEERVGGLGVAVEVVVEFAFEEVGDEFLDRHGGIRGNLAGA